MYYIFFLLLFFVCVFFWGSVVLLHKIKTGRWKLNHFTFSIRNYYILVSPIILSLIILAWLAESTQLVFVFVVFAIFGVLGEIIFAELWRLFFKKRFWTYRVEVELHGMTSWLNFIPWGMGAFLYLAIFEIVGFNILALAVAFGVGAAFIEYIFGKATEFFISKKLWTYNYLAFDKGHFTPLAIPAFALGGFYFIIIWLVISNII